eukprot:352869-Chlamydomonas_euryale.AAC.1
MSWRAQVYPGRGGQDTWKLEGRADPRQLQVCTAANCAALAQLFHAWQMPPGQTRTGSVGRR